MFNYTIRDRDGVISDPASVSVLVEAVSRPPVANNDQYEYEYTGTPQPVRLEVLSNDANPAGSRTELLIESATQGQYTQVEISEDRRALIYTMTWPPNSSDIERVSDSFTYTVRNADGAISEPATVSLTVYFQSESTPETTDSSILIAPVEPDEPTGDPNFNG